MAGTIGWYINDVVTLNRLFMTHAEGTGYGTDLSSEFLRHFVPNVKELHIVLNLPRSDYEGLERFPAPREIASSTSPSTSDLLKATWLRIPTAINSMHHLQKLNIWLDLNAPFSWSILNERAILSPLLPFHNSPTNILINLPILHPKHENPSRHFTSDTDPFPIPIHRRYRAQIRTATASNGSVYEMVRLDYPQCSDFASFMLCDGDIGGDEVNVTREEEEEWERRQWKMGRDPVKEFRDFIVEMDRGLCGLGTI